MKRKSGEKRNAYSAERSNGGQASVEWGYPGKGREEILDLEAYTEGIFDRQ
jgi:hypothetical protein